ncbi:hypothetical protein BU26DRAFT_170614 [Trematosphaeria pertusa]|uniref:Uncharacterized protein n=1 Tax=Trematosphaeria pertusa TaxID=390896 RepID=A0A6A6HVP1_9PLEO|nr:uncharacterized protein BU26DRAFT_170614 [Trematosphaeria pertusa]KAF2241802.1 hypothetical protein BU26DRAFT_170614 [Trematosphaeria pertusa]
MQQGTAQPTPGLTAPGAQPTLVLGEPITLGPATLTLTPGLSTTVGTGSTAVYVGITINTAGQTIITVSSSGTAVTATITDAPATVTLPRTGFDASITGAARPGEHDSSSAGGVAATTSSKAGAMERIETMDCWVGIVLGIMGLGIAL